MIVKGINAKQSRGEINLGINIEQFIQQLQELPTTNGWTNLILVPLTTPHPKGYTHFIRPQTPKDGSTKGE
jgi:hypothetical protein